MGLLCVMSTWADEVTVTWDYKCVTEKSSADQTLTAGGLDLTVVNNGGGTSDYVNVATDFLHWNGSSSSSIRHAKFTAPEDGTITVKYKSNNKDATDRIVAVGKSVVTGTDVATLKENTNVYAAGWTNASTTQTINANIKAGDVYIYNASGGCSIIEISYTYTKNEGPQTAYTAPTITVGSFDYINWTYPVTLTTATGEDGVIDYQVGSEEKVENAVSGTKINVPVNTTIVATVHGNDYDASSESSKTTAAAPAIPVPTYEISAYDFSTGKYTLTIYPGVEGLRIRYQDGSRYPWYSAPMLVDPNTTVSTVRTVHLTNNNIYSSVINIAIPAAPTDGEETFKTTGAGSNDNEVKDINNVLTAGSLAGTYIAGINGSTALKLRAGKSTSVDGVKGIEIKVTDGFAINKVTWSNTYSNDQTKTLTVKNCYVDGEKIDFTEQVMPVSVEKGQTQTYIDFNVDGFAAKESIVFELEGEATQFRAAITINGVVPVHNANVTPDGYGTMYYEKELIVPANTTAYKGTIEGNSLVLVVVAEAGESIPANTPVIIVGEGGLFTLGTTDAAAIASDLKGVATATAVSSLGATGTICTLGYENSVSGFYRFSGETIAANKCYIDVPAQNEARLRMVFANEETAINGVSIVNTKEAVSYNLAGQRVNANTKGMVIMNGKKYINN